MKKVGIIGGLGPVSTVDYYTGYIERVREKFGDNVYPEFTVENVNMDKVVSNISKGNYEVVADYLISAIENVKAAGADIAAIASNTPHIAWKYMEDRLPLPTVSIIDASVEAMCNLGYKRVLIFGTEYIMKSGLYDDRLLQRGLTPILPSEEDITRIQSIIFPNLENNIIITEERMTMIELAEKYINSERADAMLLGCTEIPLVIKSGDVSVPVLNTTQIHLDAIFSESIK